MRKKTFITALVIVASFPAYLYAQVTPPIMGWSSWNTFHVNISDSLIRAQADALVRLGL